MTPSVPATPRSAVFPRVELGEGTPSSSATGTFEVVRSTELEKADSGRRSIARAEDRADRIVAQAHEQAAAHVAQARAEIAAAHSAWCAAQADLFESRTAMAIDLLCRTTGQIAEAVIAAIFERMPSLPIQASVDIAVRLLRSEMRSHVLCHSLDFDSVSAAAASLGASLTQTDEAVRPGELMFRDAQGEVRVDGTEALLQLLADWKTALGVALPQPQPLPMPPFATHEWRPAAQPSTAESETLQ